MKKSAWIGAVLAVSLLASLAQAQERRRIEREHERERFHTPHWVFDDRFHHNHYYPALGYSVTALPLGAVSIGFRTGRFWFHSGVWFQPAGAGFVVVRPPVGILLPVLPPAYSTVYYGNVPYYYANDVYYEQQPGGYAVVEPPMGAGPGQAPPAGAPQASAPQAPGVWYYCESSKSYYPYVSDCREGWKTVPSTPPQPPR